MIRVFWARVLLVVLGCGFASVPAHADDHLWTTRGLLGRRVTWLAIAPSSPGTIYAVAPGEINEIFKSTDGGTSWTAVFADPSSFSVKSVTVDPSAPGILYVVGFGVLKSVDGGESWNPMNTGLTFLAVNFLVIDPQSPATLYVAANGEGIFKSIDGGNHWSAVSTGLPRVAGFGGTTHIPSVSALALDPQDPRTLYAGFTAQQGIYKSTDAGAHWSPVNEGLNREYQVDALVVDPLDSSRLYAISASLVHKTEDGGAHWRAANAGVTSGLLFCLAVDPSFPTTLYLGTGNAGVFRSLDGAESWSPFNDGLVDTIIFSLALARGGLAIYAGTWGSGVFDRDLRPDRLLIVPSPTRPRLPNDLGPRP